MIGTVMGAFVAASVIASVGPPLASAASSDGGSIPDIEAPPAALDLLAPGLLGAGDLGLPDTWLLTDLDPALVDDAAFTALLDPLAGVLSCPDGLFRDPTAPWISRQFDGVGGPLDDGLLFFETTLTAETADAANADRQAVSACAAVSDGTIVHRSGVLEVPTFMPDGSLNSEPPTPIDFVAVDVVAPVTDERPYPVAATAVWAHRDGITVVAVVMGTSIEPVDGEAAAAKPAEWLAETVLSRFGIDPG